MEGPGVKRAIGGTRSALERKIHLRSGVQRQLRIQDGGGLSRGLWVVGTSGLGLTRGIGTRVFVVTKGAVLEVVVLWLQDAQRL